MKISDFYRKLAVIMLVVFSLGVLSGCAAKLPEGFDEADVRSAAENVINLLNQRDSDGLTALMTEEMKVVLTTEVQAQIFELLDGAGAFQEISTLKMAGTTQSGVTYAAVAAKVKYENGDVTYTISFDEDMKLAGLYLK